MDPELANALAYRAEVYQAQGMVMVQMRGSLPEAMSRLRAHAFAYNQSMHQVAIDVLAGNLRFSGDR